MTMMFLCSLTDLVITINSAYHLSIRKLQKKLSLVKEIWSGHEKYDDRWIYDGQTDRQANRRTDNITTNNIILPVLRWIRDISVL